MGGWGPRPPQKSLPAKFFKDLTQKSGAEVKILKNAKALGFLVKSILRLSLKFCSFLTVFFSP